MATWYVYRGKNKDTREVYYGVSLDPIKRRDGSHCVGGTKAVRHWDCENDEIEWKVVSVHRSQQAASSKAHALERAGYRGYDVILTGGI